MNNRRQEKVTWWLGWVGDMPRVTTFLLQKPWLSAWALPKTVNATLRAIGIVAFANSPLSGLFILSAMFVGNPAVAWASLLAGLVGVVFSKLLHQPEQLISDGAVVFNGVLVGCISVALFPSLSGHQVDALFWLALTAMLVITAYIDKGLNALMLPSTLPALSVPFNIAAVLMLLSMRSSAGLTGTLGPDTQQYSGSNDSGALPSLSENTTEKVEWLKVMEGSVLAAGQIYGVGTMDASILILLGFLVFSPLLTLFFLIGSVIGSLLGVLMSPAPYLEVYAGLWGYNALLTAGGVVYFLQVTPAAVLAAAVAATLAALVQAASGHVFSAMMVPVLSYPFNVALLLLLAISTTPDPPLLWVQHRTFPEQHLYLHLKALRRKDNVAAPENRNQEELQQITSK